jgi:hypothetical protein
MVDSRTAVSVPDFFEKAETERLKQNCSGRRYDTRTDLSIRPAKHSRVGRLRMADGMESTGWVVLLRSTDITAGGLNTVPACQLGISLAAAMRHGQMTSLVGVDLLASPGIGGACCKGLAA